MPALIAFAIVFGFGGTVFTAMFRLIEGRWPGWFIMPWMFFSRNLRIARLIADSIRSNTPPWSGSSCRGLSLQLLGEYSWESETKPTKAEVNGVLIRFNPLELRLIRKAMKARGSERAERAIHDALSKFVTDTTRSAETAK